MPMPARGLERLPGGRLRVLGGLHLHLSIRHDRGAKPCLIHARYAS